MTNKARLVREIGGERGATHAALYAPQPALCGCVRAYLSRSTIDIAALGPDVRSNYFPPTPTCVFVWVIRGFDSRVSVQSREQVDGALQLPVVFSGPHTRPSSSVNDGPVHFFTLLMYPDALHSLTGMDIAPHLNRYSDFCSLFDSDWQQMAREVFLARDDAERIQIIEDFLCPRWQVAQLSQPKDACSANDVRPNELVAARGNSQAIDTWSTGVAQRASRSGKVLGERQVNRRIKTWTGQSLRQLRGVGRMEHALLGVNGAKGHLALDWSDLATESGFSDQAHMCREFRRYMGMPPGEMRRSLTTESAWVLRVWV